MIGLERFRDTFGNFERTAYRIEARDRYAMAEEGEPLRRFLAGEPDDLAWQARWTGRVRDLTASGRRVARVRIVSVPLSDYARFGLAASIEAIRSGEDIRYLRRVAGLPRQDFWIFDRRTVAVLHHDLDGAFVGASLVTDPPTVAGYQRQWERARALSVTRSEFVVSARV
ncbi:MAG: hypothetical protein HOY71_25060 [Nonomuraea sp.]|nr:hypothetical protein [Nonomuraea sp.]